jgi:hypothetical protein
LNNPTITLAIPFLECFESFSMALGMEVGDIIMTAMKRSAESEEDGEGKIGCTKLLLLFLSLV